VGLVGIVGNVVKHLEVHHATDFAIAFVCLVLGGSLAWVIAMVHHHENVMLMDAPAKDQGASQQITEHDQVVENKDTDPQPNFVNDTTSPSAAASAQNIASSKSKFNTTRLEYLSTKPWPGIVTDFERERQQKAITKLNEMRQVMQTWLDHEKSSDEQFKSIVLDDVTLCRFLRARDSNVKAASEMLIAHYEWRKSSSLLDTTKPLCPLCIKDPLQHCYFFIGHDCYNRAVMYSCSARAKHIGSKEGIFHIVTEIEEFLNDDQGCSQIVWIVDFRGFQTRHANPDLGRLSASLFQANFPERLGQIVLLDFPFIFTVFLRIITPFLDPVTKAKICVLTREDDQTRYYTDHWDEKMVEFLTKTRKLEAAPGSFPANSEIQSRYHNLVSSGRSSASTGGERRAG